MLGADYGEVRARLIKEERIEKYLHIFFNGEYFETIGRSINEGNWGEAFRAVHSLKGVSLTLGFQKLYQASDALCDMLRDCVTPEADISGPVQELQVQSVQLMPAVRRQSDFQLRRLRPCSRRSLRRLRQV